MVVKQHQTHQTAMVVRQVAEEQAELPPQVQAQVLVAQELCKELLDL